jgi:thiol:disulfide interchange protein
VEGGIMNLKLFFLCCVLPMFGIVAMALWGKLSLGSMIIITIVLGIGTVQVYDSFKKALKKQ